MAGSTRPSIQRRKDSPSSRRRKTCKNACLDKCADRNPLKVSDVNTNYVHMTADDIAWACLHNVRLLLCSACGCIWERYHEVNGLCLRKIGTFSQRRLPHVFVRYTSPI
jgi:hypothetical protein